MYGSLISIAGDDDSSILVRSGCGLDALQRDRVLGQVDAALLLEFVAEVINQALIEIFAAEEGVAVGGEHFKLFSPSTSAISMIDTSKVPPPRS